MGNMLLFFNNLRRNIFTNICTIFFRIRTGLTFHANILNIYMINVINIFQDTVMFTTFVDFIMFIY